MSNHQPRLSIGLPVFNGENYLEAALDSLLAQTYSDFELIISDNASTDRTQEICQAYATKDPRIRYYRNEQNLGATKNFNRVFELSLGKYFKWAAHDDVCASEYLERCIEVLDCDPSIILCHCKTGIIDEHGNPYLNYIVELDTASTKRYKRFRDMISIEHWCFQAFGVIRANELRKTPLIESYSGSDRTLLAELCLMGRVYEIPEYLFYRREHPETSTRMYPGELERRKWFDPNSTRQFHIPMGIKFSKYFASIKRVPMSQYERILCYLQLSRWVVEKTSLRLARSLHFKLDRSHIAIPIDGVEWS